MLFRSGAQKNYDRCGHREVVTDKLVDGGILAARLVCPRVEDDGLDVRVRARDLAVGMSSNDGMRVIEVRDNQTQRYLREDAIFESPSDATRHLGVEAAKSACNGCQFSKMRPLEVSQARQAADAERLALAESEVERLKTAEALKAAYDELNGLRDSIVRPQLPEPGE